MITTGDISSLTAEVFGKAWELLKPEHHLYYFGQQNLARLVTECGLEVKNVSHPGKYYSSDYLSGKVRKKFVPSPLTPVYNAFYRATKSVRLIPDSVYVNLFDIMLMIAVKP